MHLYRWCVRSVRSGASSRSTPKEQRFERVRCVHPSQCEVRRLHSNCDWKVAKTFDVNRRFRSQAF